MIHKHYLMQLAFDKPKRRTYVYPDGTSEEFAPIRKLTVMKTGCHVMSVNNDKQFIVHPGWRYIVQETQ